MSARLSALTDRADIQSRSKAPSDELTAGDEGITTTDSALSNLFGRGLIYAGIFALQSATLVIVTPLTVRTINKTEFGRFVTVSTLVALLIAVLGFGLGTPIQRQYSADKGHYKDTRGLLGIGVLLALGSTVLVFLTGPWWASVLRVGPYDASLKFGVWSAGLAAIALLLSYFIRSQDRLRAFLLVMVPLAVGSQILGLAFIKWLQPTASAYLAGVCVGELIAVVVGLVIARPRLLGMGQRHVLFSALALALPLIPAGIAYQALNLGDRIVVQHVMGPFAVGQYQLAYNTSALVMMALMLLSVAWLPSILAIGDVELKKSVLAKSRDQLYILLVPLTIGICMGAPFALRILAPPSYQTDSLLMIVSLVAIAAIPFSSYLASSRVLIVFGRTRALVWITPAAAVINLVLNIALVPIWGLTASAIATLIGYGVLALLTGWNSRKLAKLPPARTGIWLALDAAVAISLGAGALPVSPFFLGLRLCVALICALWTVGYIVRLVKGLHIADGAPRPLLVTNISNRVVGRAARGRRPSV